MPCEWQDPWTQVSLQTTIKLFFLSWFKSILFYWNKHVSNSTSSCCKRITQNKEHSPLQQNMKLRSYRVHHSQTHRTMLSFCLSSRNQVRHYRDASFSLLDNMVTASVTATLQIYDWGTQFLGNSSVMQKIIQTIISMALEQFQSNTISQFHACFGDFFSAFIPSFYVQAKKQGRMHLVLPI